MEGVGGWDVGWSDGRSDSLGSRLPVGVFCASLGLRAFGTRFGLLLGLSLFLLFWGIWIFILFIYRYLGFFVSRFVLGLGDFVFHVPPLDSFPHSSVVDCRRQFEKLERVVTRLL